MILESVGGFIIYRLDKPMRTMHFSLRSLGDGDPNMIDEPPGMEMDEFVALLVTASISTETFVEEVVTSRNCTEAKTSTAVLPDDKRMEMIFARTPEDHDTRGVKNTIYAWRNRSSNVCLRKCLRDI